MVTTKSFCQASIIAGIIFILAGCSSLGRDNVLFLTKTSLGVDVDSKPLTLDVGYDRKEGVIGPVMEKGLIHNNMGSFHTEVGIVNQSIGQSFSTGQAAAIMSKYIASSARPKPVEIITENEIFDKVNELDIPLEKKRYVFVTDTSFGFRVNFGMETGGVPDALSLGYKRKEMAFVPLVKGIEVGVIKQKATDNAKKASDKEALASLLATVKLGTATSNPLGTSLTFSQFFATGNAASYLAAHPEIRSVMAQQMIPDAEDALASVKMKMARENLEKISEASPGKKEIMDYHDDSTKNAANDIENFVIGLGYATYSHFVANQPKKPSDEEIKALMTAPAIKGKCGF